MGYFARAVLRGIHALRGWFDNGLSKLATQNVQMLICAIRMLFTIDTRKLMGDTGGPSAGIHLV